MGEQNYLSSGDRTTMGIVLRSGDYGWTEPLTTRKYYLTNPKDVMKFDLFTYMSAFRGSGHSEWEAIWGWFLKDAAGRSIATGERCDISAIFNRDFLARNDRKFTRQQVWDHIHTFFKIESETEDEVVLTLNT